MRQLCLSQVQALTELPPYPHGGGGGVYYLIGNVSKMNLKVNQQILHSKGGGGGETPFFVPKTVDMLVQQPQDQAVNLFFSY